MKNFRIVADATFEATDIDDAFDRMAKHFSYLCDNEKTGEDPQVIISGNISIQKIEA